MNELEWLSFEALLEWMILESAERVASTKARLWRFREVGR